MTEIEVIRIRWRSLKKKEKEYEAPQHVFSQDILLSKKLEQNIKFFSSLYKESPDVIFCSIVVGKNDAAIIYIEGLSDTQKLEEQVLEILLSENQFDESNLLLSIKNRLPITNVKKVSTYLACVEAIAIGNPILLLDGSLKTQH